MHLILSDYHEFEETAYLSKITFNYNFFKRSIPLQSLLLKVVKQLLSVEVTKLIDVNLWSFSSVVLIKGQSEMDGYILVVAVTLKTPGFSWLNQESWMFYGVWNGLSQLIIISPTMSVILLLRNTDSCDTTCDDKM